jgi:hypothetical protein
MVETAGWVELWFLFIFFHCDLQCYVFVCCNSRELCLFVLFFRLLIKHLVFESGPEVQNGGNGWVSGTVIFVHLFSLWFSSHGLVSNVVFFVQAFQLWLVFFCFHSESIALTVPSFVMTASRLQSDRLLSFLSFCTMHIICVWISVFMIGTDCFGDCYYVEFFVTINSYNSKNK